MTAGLMRGDSNSEHGGSIFYSPTANQCPLRTEASTFGAAIRLKLGCAHRQIPDNTIYRCDGCNTSFTKLMAWQHHVISCSRRRGFNVTVAHNSVAAALHDLLRRAGLHPLLEPRHYEHVCCEGCKVTMTVAEHATHKCVNENPGHCGGADVQFRIGDTMHTVDVTLLASEAQSYSKTSLESLVKTRTAAKMAKYGEQTALAKEVFHVVIIFVPTGIMAGQSQSLARIIEAGARRPPQRAARSAPTRSRTAMTSCLVS